MRHYVWQEELYHACLQLIWCISESVLTVQGGVSAQGVSGKHWDKKGASRRADVVGALRAGLDRLAEVSCSALQRVGSSDLLQRFWVCLEARLCPLHTPSDAAVAWHCWMLT